jgi:hypothetical protein
MPCVVLLAALELAAVWVVPAYAGRPRKSLASALIANKTASSALVSTNAHHRLLLEVMARITLPRQPAVVHGELAAAREIANVEGNAEEICGNKTKLSRPEVDDADQQAIRAGDYPPLPQSPSNQHRGKDCESTGAD